MCFLIKYVEARSYGKGEKSSLAVAKEALHAFCGKKCTVVSTRPVQTAETLEADLRISASDMLKCSWKIEMSYQTTVEDINPCFVNGPIAIAFTADFGMENS